MSFIFIAKEPWELAQPLPGVVDSPWSCSSREMFTPLRCGCQTHLYSQGTPGCKVLRDFQSGPLYLPDPWGTAVPAPLGLPRPCPQPRSPHQLPGSVSTAGTHRAGLQLPRPHSAPVQDWPWLPQPREVPDVQGWGCARAPQASLLPARGSPSAPLALGRCWPKRCPGTVPLSARALSAVALTEKLLPARAVLARIPQQGGSRAVLCERLPANSWHSKRNARSR